VVVTLGSCPSVDCTASPSPVPLPVSFTAAATASGTSATLAVLQSSENGREAVVGYDVRYSVLPPSGTIDATTFPDWTPAPPLPVAAPGTSTSDHIDGLAPVTTYGVGISALGVCGNSKPTFQVFTTPKIHFAQLSG